MRRLISLIIAVFMVAALFIGCGQKADTKAETSSAVQASSAAEATVPEVTLSGKITFATNMTNKVDSTLADLVKEFTAKYPGTEVEIEGLKDPEGTLKVRMAAGELPDVSVAVATKTSDYPKYYAPIDDLGFTEDNINFYKSGLGDDGKLYRITSAVSYTGVVYNKKAFKEAGVEKVPTTIEEFYAACELLKAKGIVPVASNFKDAWPLTFWSGMYPIEALSNVNYYNELVSKNEFLSNDGGILAGFNLVKTLKEKGYLEKDLMSTSWDGMKKDLATGKIAMAYIASWFPPQVVENGALQEDIGMFPFPGVKAVLAANDLFFAVSADSKNLETAKAFLKFAWEDSRYQNAIDATTPIKGATIKNASINEILTYNVPVVNSVPYFDDYISILTKGQLDYNKILQEYLLSKDPDSIVAKYNKVWAETKKGLGL